jgi:PAS domain S-box-containing protein
MTKQLNKGAEGKQPKDTIEPSEAFFRLLTTYCPVGIFATNNEGRCIYTNPQCQSILGWSCEENLGHWTSCVHAEDRQSVFEDWSAHIGQGRDWSCQLRVLTPQGTTKWVQMRSSALLNEDDKLTGYVHTVEDISDRQAAIGFSMTQITQPHDVEEALHKSEALARARTEELAAFMEIVPAAVWISHDPQCHQMTANQAAYELMRATPGSVATATPTDGRYPFKFKLKRNGQEIPLQELSMQKAARTGQVVDENAELIFDDGVVRYFYGKAVPLRDELGEVRGVIGAYLDITEGKQAEKELEQLLVREQVARLAAEKARAEAELERSRLREFFMKAPALIAVTRGANHVFEFANSAYQQVAGRQEQDLIGKPTREVFPELEGQGFFEAIDEVYHTGIAFTGNEMPAIYDRNHDGTLYEGFFNFVYQPLYNSNREVEGILLHAVEVTEQVRSRQRTEELLQQLEAQRAFLEAVLQQMPAGVIIAEAPLGKLILGNKQVEQIWRHPFMAAEQVEQYNDYKGFHPDGQLYKPEEWPLARSITTGEVVSGEEIKFLRGDETYGVIEVSSAPICDRQGQIIAGVVTFQDISDRKVAQKELTQLLAREQAARAEAELANRLKDEFLAVLSHELRSPLNPILGWAKLLQSRQFDHATIKQALETIERNAKLQVQLVDDLLDVSRIFQGKLSLKVCHVDLATVINAAIETVTLAATAKSIQIQTVFAPNVRQVIGDFNRLQQVVWNLLSNAIKFTPIGGRVEIRLEEVDTHAQIQVIDNGQGISADFLPYVFDYFRQADSSITRKFGGLGLGLAIVRHITELHGGRVYTHSQGEGRGATFTVRLPVTNLQEPHQNDQPTTRVTTLNGVKILVVDDEADIRELITFILEEHGAQVIAATSASEALEAFTQFLPDILISDIGMPNIDGYTLMRQVRALAPNQGGQTPAIALTAYAGEFNEKQALAVGFDKHIAKPVEPEHLVQVISSLVNSAGSIE